jgi:hypothetical protein
LGRVNAAGCFAEIYVKMSKIDPETKMYTPWEATFRNPEVMDPQLKWFDVWGPAFFLSDKSLYTGLGGVDVQKGVAALKFAELAGKSFESGGKLVQPE